jgi:hypothetical protein
VITIAPKSDDQLHWPGRPTNMLRRRIAFSTAVVSLVLSLTLIGAGIWMGRAIVSIMSAQMIRLMNDDVRRDVAETIQAGERMLARVANDIVRHDVPIDSPSALGRELYGLMIDPRYDWLFCGNEAGGAMDVGRLGDGTLVFLMTDGLRAGVMREYEASAQRRRTAIIGRSPIPVPPSPFSA